MRAVRLLGVVLPARLCVCRALRAVYGIGRVRALQVCRLARVPREIVVCNLGGGGVSRLRRVAARSLLGPALRRRREAVLDGHKAIGTAPGRRHRSGLPVRGQRTRTNARTRKDSRGKLKHQEKRKNNKL